MRVIPGHKHGKSEHYRANILFTLVLGHHDQYDSHKSEYRSEIFRLKKIYKNIVAFNSGNGKYPCGKRSSYV